MVSTEGRFLQWLRDAHAMEEQAQQMLSGTTRRIKNYPELKAQLERHLDETRRHADMVRRCIERRGSNISTLKDTAAKLVAVGQVLSGLFVGDEIVKAALANYTFEHMEIGSYRILIATAEALADTETKLVCEQILREEENMARWLEDNLPSVTKQYLDREKTSGVTAKH
jgi:ferritin-like metal-binding protein YciE